MSLTPEITKHSNQLWVGDINVAGGQLGLCAFTPQTVSLDQATDFDEIYSRYVLEPTNPGLNFTLDKIGTGLNQIATGYSVLVVNEGTESIDLLEDSGTLVITVPAQTLVWTIAETAGVPDSWFVLYQTAIVYGTSTYSNNYNNTLFVDQTYGNDATGQRESPNFPFARLEAAYAAAQPRDQIIVYSFIVTAADVDTDKLVYWYNASVPNPDSNDTLQTLNSLPGQNNYYYGYGFSPAVNFTENTTSDLLYRFFLSNPALLSTAAITIGITLNDTVSSGTVDHQNWTVVVEGSYHVQPTAIPILDLETNRGYSFIRGVSLDDYQLSCLSSNPNYQNFEQCRTVSFGTYVSNDNTEVTIASSELSDDGIPEFTLNNLSSLVIWSSPLRLSSISSLTGSNHLLMNRVSNQINLSGVAGQAAHVSCKAQELDIDCQHEGSQTLRVANITNSYNLINNQDLYVEGFSESSTTNATAITRQAYHFILGSIEPSSFIVNDANNLFLSITGRALSGSTPITITTSGKLFLTSSNFIAGLTYIGSGANSGLLSMTQTNLGDMRYEGSARLLSQMSVVRDIDHTLSSNEDTITTTLAKEIRDYSLSQNDQQNHLCSAYYFSNETTHIRGVGISGTDPVRPRIIFHADTKRGTSIGVPSDSLSGQVFSTNSLAVVKAGNFTTHNILENIDPENQQGIIVFDILDATTTFIGDETQTNPLNHQIFVNILGSSTLADVFTGVAGGSLGVANVFIENNGTLNYERIYYAPLVFVTSLGAAVTSFIPLRLQRGELQIDTNESTHIELVNNASDAGIIDRKLVARGRIVDSTDGILVTSDPTNTQIITIHLAVISTDFTIQNASGINVNIQEESTLTGNNGNDPTNLTELINTIGVNAALPDYR